jgi:proteic killer suppression protein
MEVHLKIKISRKALKDLKTIPDYVKDKLQDWVESVETQGMAKTRKISGWHDELLKGQRRGQRSIRLSKSYRAIYEEESCELIEIVEVNKHDY